MVNRAGRVDCMGRTGVEERANRRCCLESVKVEMSVRSGNWRGEESSLRFAQGMLRSASRRPD